MKQRYFSNINIYMVIIIASVFVVLLGVNTYESAKDRLIELSNKNKITISENILDTFGFWFDERINAVNRASNFIEHSNILKSDSQTASFLKNFYENSPEFDVVQLLTEKGDIWVNGEKIPPNDNIAPRSGLIWYVETKNVQGPTVNFMHKHRSLNQGTLNFCVPNYMDGEFAAVLCGVVKVESIFEKIKNFKLPPDSYSFIVTHSGEILTPMSDQKLKKDIEESFKELFLTNIDKKTLNLGSNFIAISEIKYLNWFVGAGSDNSKETSKLIGDIGKNSVALLFGFIALALIANLLHNLMYAKINKRKKEYEIILAHKAKMSEAGELISGINHQFIQPVNSLNLMISTLLMLEYEDKLDKKTLKDMLVSGEKSVMLLNDTIKIFRNFYNTNESLSEFSVKQSIKNLLTLMHTELSRANVSVNLNEFEDKKVTQIENIIQQILLILLHNAKDALTDKFKDDVASRRISIDVKFDDERCYIDVSEFGGGVSDELAKAIFAEPRTTKKHGSGIGLYFAKKLANEKIGGDLTLLNKAMPTVFELSFEMNLKG
ncbi:cache domain-containing protein [Campylobacter sp. RM9328]|uniref:sensor histidine kinase n=1 Tax=Campylobacter sp. RM9328 TaxID=1705720 RepID=UPI00147276A3|nr:cache domain-containing protein [Campylobacter sp. RM9328]